MSASTGGSSKSGTIKPDFTTACHPENNFTIAASRGEYNCSGCPEKVIFTRYKVPKSFKFVIATSSSHFSQFIMKSLKLQGKNHLTATNFTTHSYYHI
jgi:hypothetical protein